MSQIERIPVPNPFEPGDFSEALQLGLDVEVLEAGTEHIRYEPSELVPWWHREWEPRELWDIRVDGRVVATCEYTWETGSPEVVTAWIAVHPAHRGRGFGAELADWTVERARSEGREAVQSWTVQPADAARGALPSPTGFGAVDADRPGPRLALSRGFGLAQVERVSILDLPTPLPPLEVADGYHLERWVGPTPPERLDALAALHRAIQQDAPSGELDPGSTPWDAAKVAADDAAQAGSDIRLLTVLAVHTETDEAAGYTRIGVPPRLDRAAKQGDTVVLAGHRGHRLGMTLKVANLEQLAEVAPGHPAVLTYNAEENRHMLSVNEAVGFAPVAYEGGWRLDLTD